MNATRRLQIVAGVIVASAAAGAGAGLVVAAAMVATKFGHWRPDLIWELVKLGTQTGALVGVVIGPPTIFGLLQRVPLIRVARNVMLGAAAGGIAGFAISLTFAQPRPEIPLILTGSLVGFGLAALHLRTRLPVESRSPAAAH